MDQIKKMTKIFNDENSFAIPICFGIMANASQDDKSFRNVRYHSIFNGRSWETFLYTFLLTRESFLYTPSDMYAAEYTWYLDVKRSELRLTYQSRL